VIKTDLVYITIPVTKDPRPI